jgi:hypothetical protein
VNVVLDEPFLSDLVVETTITVPFRARRFVVFLVRVAFFFFIVDAGMDEVVKADALVEGAIMRMPLGIGTLVALTAGLGAGVARPERRLT